MALPLNSLLVQVLHLGQVGLQFLDLAKHGLTLKPVLQFFVRPTATY